MCVCIISLYNYSCLTTEAHTKTTHSWGCWIWGSMSGSRGCVGPSAKPHYAEQFRTFETTFGIVNEQNWSTYLHNTIKAVKDAMNKHLKIFIISTKNNIVTQWLPAISEAEAALSSRCDQNHSLHRLMYWIMPTNLIGPVFSGMGKRLALTYSAKVQISDGDSDISQ
jgi:hypothetical protein